MSRTNAFSYRPPLNIVEDGKTYRLHDRKAVYSMRAALAEIKKLRATGRYYIRTRRWNLSPDTVAIYIRWKNN